MNLGEMKLVRVLGMTRVEVEPSAVFYLQRRMKPQLKFFPLEEDDYFSVIVISVPRFPISL